MIRTVRMHVGRYEVRVAPVPALVALVLFALLISAGFWQLRRADEKRDLLVEQSYRRDKEALTIDPHLVLDAPLARLRHRRGTANGTYRVDMQYLLDNRTHDGVAGYHVLTPLRLGQSDVHVLVNRGWVPVGPDRRRLPDVAVPAEAVSAAGAIVAPPAPGLVLGPTGYDDPGWPRVVQRVDMARIREQIGGPLLPFVLRLSPESEHGYLREWSAQTGLTPERHLGYAVQWFALSAALVVLCLWVAVARPTTGGGS